jgi:hypothetical protein
MTRTQKIALGAVVVILSAPVALALVATWVVVDVRQESSSVDRIWLACPLSLARWALAFAPAKAGCVQKPELAGYLPAARALASELEEISHAVLVSVESPDERVVISKKGPHLVIEVLTDEDDVLVQVPAEALTRMFDSYDGECFDLPGLLKGLSAGSGLVHVRNADQEVKVSFGRLAALGLEGLRKRSEASLGTLDGDQNVREVVLPVRQP